MVLAVAQGKTNRLDAVPVEVIAVHSATAAFTPTFNSHSLQCVHCCRNDFRLQIDKERVVKRLDIHVDRGVPALRRLGESRLETFEILFKRGIVGASSLSCHFAEIRNNIGTGSSLDDTNIRNYRGRDAAFLKMHNRVCSNTDGRESLLWLITGMGLDAVNLDLDLALGRRLIDDAAYAARRVKDESLLAFELRKIKLTRSLNADLFTDRENHFYGAVRLSAFLNATKSVQNSTQARHIVGSKN